jgi:hypothetical protein
MVNLQRSSTRTHEGLSALVASDGWLSLVDTAETEIIKPLRAKALTNAALDPREQTGIVRALQAVRSLIELPYAKLAKASGKSLEDVMPQAVGRLFT